MKLYVMLEKLGILGFCLLSPGQLFFGGSNHVAHSLSQSDPSKPPLFRELPGVTKFSICAVHVRS